MKRKPVKVDESVDVQNEPFDMKTEMLLSLLDKQLQKGEEIEVYIKLFRNHLHGKLVKVRRSPVDNTVTLFAEVADEEVDGNKWGNLTTLDNRDFKHITLTRENGKLLLISRYNKQEDESLDEAVEDSLFISMLRRLVPMVRQSRLYHQGSKHSKPTLVTRLDVFDEHSRVDLMVLSPFPGDERDWAATIPFSMADEYTIKSKGEGESKIFIITPVDAVNESTDWPMVATILKRTIADHFKNRGPAVTLLDTDFQDTPMKIHGYQVLANGDLSLNVKSDHGYRDIIYTKDLISDGTENETKLHFKRGSNGRLLVMPNSVTP